jgi:hypothetical protein
MRALLVQDLRSIRWEIISGSDNVRKLLFDPGDVQERRQLEEGRSFNKKGKSGNDLPDFPGGFWICGRVVTPAA